MGLKQFSNALNFLSSALLHSLLRPGPCLAPSCVWALLALAAIRIPILPLGDSLKDLGKGEGGASGGTPQAVLDSAHMQFGIMVLVVCGDARR